MFDCVIIADVDEKIQNGVGVSIESGKNDYKNISMGRCIKCMTFDLLVKYYYRKIQMIYLSEFKYPIMIWNIDGK